VLLSAAELGETGGRTVGVPSGNSTVSVTVSQFKKVCSDTRTEAVARVKRVVAYILLWMVSLIKAKLS
jgi:hypothetical protein